MVHLIIHWKHDLVIGIWATFDIIFIKVLSMIFIECSFTGVHFYMATEAVSSHLSDLLYTCSRCHLFSFP